MKVLRIIEKVAFILAVVFAFLAVALGGMLDGAIVLGDPSSGTAIAIVNGVVAYYLSASFTFGFGFVLVLLLVGALLYFVKENIARRIGIALAAASFIAVFAVSISLMETGFATPLVGLVAGILFGVSLLFKLIMWIVKVARPDAGEENDPSTDPKVQLILKWKGLLDQKVITEEEYELKRKEIVSSIDSKKQAK